MKTKTHIIDKIYPVLSSYSQISFTNLDELSLQWSDTLTDEEIVTSSGGFLLGVQDDSIINVLFGMIGEAVPPEYVFYKDITLLPTTSKKFELTSPDYTNGGYIFKFDANRVNIKIYLNNKSPDKSTALIILSDVEIKIVEDTDFFREG